MKTPRIPLFLVLLITGFMPVLHSAAAQRSDVTYTSETTGSVISIGSTGVGRFDPEFTGVENSGGETIEFVTVATPFSDLQISFLETPRSLEVLVEEIVVAEVTMGHRYEVLHQQVDTEFATFLSRMTYRLQFTEAGYVEIIRPVDDGRTIAIGVYASEESLIEKLNWFAANVTIDGESPFFEASYEHLQPMLDGTSDIEPRLVSDDSSGVSAWEDLGLVSDQEWISPTFGHVVTWNSSWNVPFPRNDIIEIVEGDRDSINLITPTMNGEINVGVGTDIVGIDSPQDLLHLLTSQEFTSEMTEGQKYRVIGVEISENSAGVMIEKTSFRGHTYLFTFEGYFANDGSIIVTATYASREDFAIIYQQRVEGVKIYGAPYPPAWTAEEIEELLAG